MDKVTKIGKLSAVGGFQLFIGKLLSTVILAIGSIILARFMTSTDYGLYAVALVPATTMNLFHDWGINQAMTKKIAHYRAIGQEEKIRDIIATGLIFKVATGLVLSILSLVLSNFIATTIFKRPEIAPLLSISSIVILSHSLLTAAEANFNGFERRRLNSFTLICQSVIQTTIAPLLVLVGYGTIGAILGYTFSFLVTGIISVIMLYFLLFKNLKKSNPHRTYTLKTLKTMLSYGVPLSLSTMLGSFLVQFYAFFMAFYCTDVMVGNYQIAVNFGMFLTFFTFPIVTVLFPAFSKIDSKNEPHLLKTIFRTATKYAALLLVPATLATIVLAEPLIGIVYGQKWVDAPFFLKLYVLQYLLVLFGSYVMYSFLSGVGETKVLLKMGILELLIGFPIAFILIPSYGVVGVILCTLLSTLPPFVWNRYWLWKHYKITPDFKISAKILLAASFAATTTYFTINLFTGGLWTKVLIGGSVFLITYIIMAPILRAVNKMDIQTLRMMFSDLGIISKIINIPLIFAEKVVDLTTD